MGYGFYRSELKKVAGDKLVKAATEVSKRMARNVSGAMPCQENNLASSYPTAPCYAFNCWPTLSPSSAITISNPIRQRPCHHAGVCKSLHLQWHIVPNVVQEKCAQLKSNEAVALRLLPTKSKCLPFFSQGSRRLIFELFGATTPQLTASRGEALDSKCIQPRQFARRLAQD